MIGSVGASRVRLQVMSALAETVREGLGKGTAVALLFVEIDGFDSMISAMGKQRGDLVMDEIESRLSPVIRSADALIRTGPGSVVVICADVSGSDSSIRTWLPIITRRLQVALAASPEPGQIEGVVAIGVGTVVTRARCDGEDLMAAGARSQRPSHHGQAVFVDDAIGTSIPAHEDGASFLAGVLNPW